MKVYYWICSSNDGSYSDKSKTMFNKKKDCYNDMRNSALEKIKFNTEYDEDFCDSKSIDYGVQFSQDKIIHQSYSGIYTYEVIEIDKNKVEKKKIYIGFKKTKYDKDYLDNESDSLKYSLYKNNTDTDTSLISIYESEKYFLNDVNINMEHISNYYWYRIEICAIPII